MPFPINQGLKYGEIQLIVNLFRGQIDAARDSNSNDRDGAPGKRMSIKTDGAESKNVVTDRIAVAPDLRFQPLTISDNQAQLNRLNPLEKLVKKKR